MSLWLGALTIGFILSLLTLGTYITYRVFNQADMTVDGSFALGGCVAALLLVSGSDPLLATLAAGIAGAMAGMVTGLLHARFRVNALLAGILVMTALYSVNLHVLGKSNMPLLQNPTLITWGEQAAARCIHTPALLLAGWSVSVRDMATLLLMGGIVTGVCLILYWFLRTDLGTAMRAAGDNPEMTRALGVNVGRLQVAGLALANGLVGISGALMTQYQGFADVQMGIGMVVLGLASVIIGESLTGSRQLGLALYGAVAGAVLFRLLIAIALRWGLNPNDLKLVTALFVLGALILPVITGRQSKKLRLLTPTRD